MSSANRQRGPVEPRRPVLMLDSPGLAPFQRVEPPYFVRILGWPDLIEAVRYAPPAAVVLIDPEILDGDPVPLSSRVSELLAAARMIPVVAILAFEDRFAGSIRMLLERGVADIADSRFEAGAAALATRLAGVHAAPLKKLLEASLSRFTSGDALTLLRAAAEVAVDRGRAIDLARKFGSSERTVSGWCIREGLPPPRRLLAWLRVLLALALLEESHRSVLHVAECTGYSSDYPLRRSVREFLGKKVALRDYSASGALAVFNSELRELRERARREFSRCRVP